MPGDLPVRVTLGPHREHRTAPQRVHHGEAFVERVDAGRHPFDLGVRGKRGEGVSVQRGTRGS